MADHSSKPKNLGVAEAVSAIPGQSIVNLRFKIEGEWVEVQLGQKLAVELQPKLTAAIDRS